MELAALYRERQQTDEELALLSRFESELTVENGLLMRLAELRAGSGDREGAIRLLMRPEVLSTQCGPCATRTSVFCWPSCLLELGAKRRGCAIGQAVDLAMARAMAGRSPLTQRCAACAAADASELGDAVAVLHPEIRFFLVRGLAEMGVRPLARHLLETWINANPSPSMNEIAAFLSACRDQDEPRIVWQAFSAVLETPPFE